jgi:hypothetical protein
MAAPAPRESDESAANAPLNRVEEERLGALMVAPPTRVEFPEVAVQWVLPVRGQMKSALASGEAEWAHPGPMTSQTRPAAADRARRDAKAAVAISVAAVAGA